MSTRLAITHKENNQSSACIYAVLWKCVIYFRTNFWKIKRENFVNFQNLTFFIWHQFKQC